MPHLSEERTASTSAHQMAGGRGDSGLSPWERDCVRRRALALWWEAGCPQLRDRELWGLAQLQVLKSFPRG